MKPRRSRWKRALLLAAALLALLALALALSLPWLIRAVGGASRGAPHDLARSLDAQGRAVLAAALEGLDPARRLDHHVHVAGSAGDGSGCELDPAMLSWTTPRERLQFLVYADAARIVDLERGAQQYIERLSELARAGPGGRSLLLAFDRFHDAAGRPVPAESPLFVPNDWVLHLAQEWPERFIPAASIHPWRADAVAELERVVARGVRVVKWLPSAMGIDPLDARCDPFYAALARLDVALLTHAGEEQALDAAGRQHLSNPLRLRRALEQGVQVIVAHCASLGTDVDLDDPALPRRASFDLFLRMMDEPRWQGLLFGEISAITQHNRCGRPLATLLQRSDLHPRLVDGSDYPLPAINFIVWTGKLERLGYLTAAERRALDVVYYHDPLLFDLALKRTLRHPATGARFPAEVFHDRLGLRTPR